MADLRIEFDDESAVSLRAATVHQTAKARWIEPPKASSGGACFSVIQFEGDLKAEFRRLGLSAVDELLATGHCTPSQAEGAIHG